MLPFRFFVILFSSFSVLIRHSDISVTILQPSWSMLKLRMIARVKKNVVAQIMAAWETRPKLKYCIKAISHEGELIPKMNERSP